MEHLLHRLYGVDAHGCCLYFVKFYGQRNFINFVN